MIQEQIASYTYALSVGLFILMISGWVRTIDGTARWLSPLS